MEIFLLTFEGVEHPDASVHSGVEDAVSFVLVQVASLDGCDHFAHVESHQRVEFRDVGEFVVDVLASRSVELLFYAFIHNAVRSDNLLTKKFPNLSPPAITP